MPVHVQVLFLDDDIMKDNQTIVTRLHSLSPHANCSWVLVEIAPLKATGGELLVRNSAQGLLARAPLRHFFARFDLFDIEINLMVRGHDAVGHDYVPELIADSSSTFE